MGDTVVKLFENLTPEQREKVATNVLEKWLSEPYSAEKRVKEEEILKEIRRRNDSYDRGKSDQEIIDSYDFQQRLSGFKSSREKMVEEITKQSVEFYKKQIEEKIKNDEKLNKVMNEVLEQIQSNFPKLVNEAMMAWFFNNMSTMANDAKMSLMQSQNAMNAVEEIVQKVLHNN